MDKNIAAFLDKNAYTVSVSFKAGAGPKKYTYVCNIPGVKVGDWVVVDAPDFDNQAAQLRQGYTPMQNIEDYMSEQPMQMAGIPQLVLVVGVDSDVNIQPNSDIAHGWVVSTLDLTSYRETLQRNSQINSLVADAYKASMRRSFADQILGCMEADGKDKLLALLNK
jgi:hypothetical protein